MNTKSRQSLASTQSRALRYAAVLGGAALMTLAAATPATAATWSHDDATGDVVRFTFDEETEQSDGVVVPENTNSDISRTVIRHRVHRVVMRNTLRDITRESGYVTFSIRTDDSSYWGVYRLGADREMPAFYLERANGRTVRCTGARRDVDRVAERGSISIPRRCLGSPRWVRVGAGISTYEPGDGSTDAFLLDDALQDDLDLETLSMSPRIRRG